ncbi:MAG: tetrahydrofolate dehydrogenase/cyclohydrolase catalytic domain-containing protein, partial [Acidimicrobiales bacterium]
VRHVELASSATQGELEAALRALSADSSVHGILLQLPLPDGLDELAAASCIDAAKDVDGMTAVSLGRLVWGAGGHRPCTASGVLDLLARHGVELAGRRAVVVGRGPMVALPLALMLAAPADGTGCAAVTVMAPDADGLADSCRAADLVVSDAGRPHLVRAEWIAPGATVVDVGVSFVDGTLTGDVDPAVAQVAGAFVPNPGGAGPMTVAWLLRNTVDAARAAGLLGARGQTSERPAERG